MLLFIKILANLTIIFLVLTLVAMATQDDWYHIPFWVRVSGFVTIMSLLSAAGLLVIAPLWAFWG